MNYLAVCTFEIRGGGKRAHATACAALESIGFAPAQAANIGRAPELPPTAVVGTYVADDPAFLRNCLCYKLEEVFARHGFDAEFLLVLSHGDLAWARGGFAQGDFAERHGRGAMKAAPA